MDAWLDDPELLRATLSMLTACEEEWTPSTDALALPPATVSATTLPARGVSSSEGDDDDDDDGISVAKSTSVVRAKKTRRVVNLSRERRRDEMRELRAKAAELQAQLASLKQRRELMLRPHRSATGEIRSVAAVWEDIATRQVRKLQRSQLTNAKLKQLVGTQCVIASDLLAAIRRAAEETVWQRELAHGWMPVPRPRLAIDASRKVSEEEQLARLEVMCSQWHEAFASTAKFWGGPPLRFLDITLVEDNGVESIVDIVSSSAAPYSKETVDDVLWQFYLKEFNEDEDSHAFLHDFKSRDKTIIGVFRAISTIDNHRTTFDGKYVVKPIRCPQGNMIIVSHMCSQPRCESNLLENVTVEEDTWFRVVRSEDVGGPKLSHPVTLMQHVRRMKIRFGPRHFNQTDDDEDPTDAQRRAGALTKFLMRQAEDEIKYYERCIENMLLDSFNSMTISSSLDMPLDGPSGIE